MISYQVLYAVLQKIIYIYVYRVIEEKNLNNDKILLDL